MEQAKKIKTARTLAVVVSAAGLLVITGWILDIGVLKSVSPDWITMKFSTALAFMLSGGTLYFIARTYEGELDKPQIFLPISTLLILLLMGVGFFSAVLGVHAGIDDLFIADSPGGVKTVIPGRPSLPTMLNFIFVSLAGLLAMFDHEKLRSGLRIFGVLIGLVGAASVAGYVTNIPLLYYFVPGVNSAMAFNTAVLFVLLGTGFLCL